MAKQKPLHLAPSVLHQHVMKQTAQTMAFDPAHNGKSHKTFVAWQRRLRRKLNELVGMHNLPMKPADRAPLRVRSVWQRDHKLGIIEKIVFTAEPYADVPAYVCLPKGSAPPHRFFICVQGHSTGMHNSIAVSREDESIPIDVPGDRDFAIGCMKRGIAALCIEQRAFGERGETEQKARSDHPCQDAVMHALLLGRTLIGERVFDVDRGIDYLESRGDVDMQHLGIMGNSGGGTTATYAAALLPRLAYAMPSCFICEHAQSIMSIYHCADNYVPRLHEYAECADVMGLFAPRPLTVVAGKDDPIFPIKGARAAFRRIQKIYEAAGAKRNCKLVVGDGGHRFYADDAWPVMMKLMDDAARGK